ncbi:MAG: hypothetical protein KDE26_26785, partial [Bacteroidetes bacterium]|nr:hypothetical protein [Bacteroidota bacterium]
FKHLDIFASLVAGLGIKSDKGEKTIFGELTFERSMSLWEANYYLASLKMNNLTLNAGVLF